jgi:2-C-methyl-D-erythritol 2,4-cyclodiphosphate synthase
VIRVGLGYDVHPFSDDAARPMVLGGVTIDGRGLAGHSDADAVCHAVADALLGPAGLPDLGTLFPASDDAHRGVSSLALLRDVVARVGAAGWTVVNVDVVVNAEEPRLAPHLADMGDCLRDALGGAHVSVTPKRGEGVGAVGRREAVQCWAVALLESAGSLAD